MAINFDYIPEKLTKEWLLERVSEEQIFEFFGIEIKEKIFCSPLRTDRNPTCNFYRNKKGRLFYKDWAVSDHHFDSIGFVMWKYNSSFTEALSIIYNEMILSKQSDKHINKKSYKRKQVIKQYKDTRINVKIREFNKSDIDYWKSFGISLSTLKYYNVFAIERAWLNKESVYLYNKKDCCYAYRFGYEKYKLYFPFRTKYRFLSSSSAIQGYSQLPNKAEFLVITKSLKDVMTLYEFGIPAIALSSETNVPDIKLLKVLSKRFDNIIMLYDNDLTGINSMNKIKSIIPCMWIPRGWNAKDISDYYKKYGKSATKRIIDYAIKKLKKWKQEKSYCLTAKLQKKSNLQQQQQLLVS